MSRELKAAFNISSHAPCGGPETGLPTRSAQQGVALVVALILLVVITLVGLAAVRGTIIQQKMASNMFDRQIAFQSAEAAMREAQSKLISNPGDVSRNCQSASVNCLANPFDSTGNTVITVSNYTASSVALGQPQYVVESMGSWQDPTSDNGFDQSANSHNYGVNGGSTTAIYYRITARSGDPTKVGDRAVVVLQAIVKQG
jgi:type IV pilus assembly protein PilX